jgi:hypothetical protein
VFFHEQVPRNCSFSAPAAEFFRYESCLKGCARDDQLVVKQNDPLPASRIMKQREEIPVQPDDARTGVLAVDRAVEESLRTSPELEQIQQRIAASMRTGEAG